MITFSDPECLSAALQLLVNMEDFQVPVDILFITSRFEPTPTFVSRLEANGRRIIRVHKASFRMDVSDDILVYPAISPQLENAYARGELTLRQIVDGSSLGIQVTFENNLSNFSKSLGGHLHG